MTTATVASAAIAADIATMGRLESVPVGALGYGTDLSCVMDITPTCDEVDPFSTRALSEALLRRLFTPRGILPDATDYGIDIRALLNHGYSTRALGALGAAIRGELIQDDRVSALTVRTAYASGRLAISLSVTPVDPFTAFSLTFTVDDRTGLIASISTTTATPIE